MTARRDHDVYTARWPMWGAWVLEDAIEEALLELPGMLLMSRVRLTGRAVWCICRGRDIPGSGGSQQVLLMTAPAIEVAPSMNVDLVPVVVSSVRHHALVAA